jgi:hypothetical protein
MTNHIRSKSKVTEGTSQSNGPNLVSLLVTVPDEDWCWTWAACRTIMLRRTSKSVKEQVDKMRLTAVVRLCELWRYGKNRSPPGGRRPRTTFHQTPSPSEWPNTMENLQIVMNQLPAMMRRLSHHRDGVASSLSIDVTASFNQLVRYTSMSILGRVAQVLVVTSALTSADVSLTSGTRSPDETDGAAGSVTHSIFVRFTSNFVHLHPLPPLQERVMSRST